MRYVIRVLCLVLALCSSSSALAWDPPGDYWTCDLVGYGRNKLSKTSSLVCAMDVCSGATNGWTAVFGNYPSYGCQLPGCDNGGCQSAIMSMTYGSGCPPGESEWTPPEGGTTVCIPSGCSAGVGKESDFEVTWIGGSSDPDPVYVCFSGCRGRFQSGGRFDITLADGTTRYNSYKGIIVVASPPLACEVSDRSGQPLTAWRTPAGTQEGPPGDPLTTSITGVGGVGSAGGGTTTSGQGWNKTDSLNLAKIATNTAAGSSEGGSSCGGVGQPVCATADVTETPGADATAADGAVGLGTALTSQVHDASSSGMEGLRASMETANLPTAGWSTRWVFNLSTFLGTAPANCATFPGLHYKTHSASLNLCSWLPYWIDLATWVLWMFTAWALWTTVYSKKEGA